MRHTLSIALVVVAVVLSLAAPGYAQGMSGRRAGDDGHHDGAVQHDGHQHDGDHEHRGHPGHPVFRGPYVYWNSYPVYVQTTPGYWYYCPSAEAYYPYVTYCLDAWVPVPAQ